MAWSDWTSHDGKGYPAPVGTKVQVFFRLVGLQTRHIGDSDRPEYLTSWVWHLNEDNVPVCKARDGDPVIRYRLWFDEGTQKQVEALKDMIKDDVIADLVVKKPEELHA